jgi:type IV pilus assembly protein PilN
MIQINLLREKPGGGGGSRVSSGPAEGIQLIHVAMALIVGLSLTGVGIMTYRVNAELTRRENQKAELEREKEKLKPIIQKKEELERKRKELDNKINVIKELKRKQRGPVRFLAELSKALPEDVWFETVSEQNNKVTINGRARNANKLADLLDNLSHSDYFTAVELPQMSEERGQVKYRVTCQFKLPDAAKPTATAQP